MIRCGRGVRRGEVADVVGERKRIGLEKVLKRDRKGSEAAVPGAAVQRERYGVRRWAAMRHKNEVKAAVRRQ